MQTGDMSLTLKVWTRDTVKIRVWDNARAFPGINALFNSSAVLSIEHAEALHHWFEYYLTY